MLALVWVSLIILAIWFCIVLVKDFLANRDNLENSSWLKTSIIGFVVNFFDVLGIGAFAPQTALLKFTKQTEDKLIPGTMNVANTLPVLLQAFIFINIIEVDPLTLILMLVSAAVGAVIGASIVSRLSEKKIRLTMGFALLATAAFMLARIMDWIQGGGDAIGLTDYKLIVAIVVNFFLGAIMTAGVGLYAPCMALVFALGMSPKVAFPIMMGSCAFLMPPASIKFIRKGAYNKKAAVAMAIPGVIAVLIAAFIVKSLPLDILRWVVLVVIIYTAATMLYAAFKKQDVGPVGEK
ncbi:MAG TPA: sulfite exporter TauE/SafE family protein [Cyclobacteriaceae bacterium]|nr:sulfite exporter TauE/SafE family protein [Cyclobacteriaceae bacterium]